MFRFWLRHQTPNPSIVGFFLLAAAIEFNAPYRQGKPKTPTIMQTEPDLDGETSESMELLE